MMTSKDVHHPRALVVYESMFGNTETIARSIGESLSRVMETDVVDVTEAPPSFAELDLLVVGAPTHAFGLSRRRTRQDAGTKGGRIEAAAGIGVREWIAALERQRSRPGRIEVFDTRSRPPKLPGSAAAAARRRLRRLGAPVGDPLSFWVGGTQGPLAEGEVERARRWGEQLAVAVTGGQERPPRADPGGRRAS